MNPKVVPLLCALCLFSPAYGQVYGNISSQEVADVVFRRLDKIPIQTHSAIYIGQTDKMEDIPSSPFYHKVIEMAGVPSDGTNMFGKVTQANGIGFVNFQEFRVAHSAYYGAFTAYNPNITDPLQAYISQARRKRILEAAQLLLDRGGEVEYIVRRGEHMARLLDNYFEAGMDAAGNNLVNYTGSYQEVSRMRSDAFVEFCYSYAGVPISRTSGNLPVYLTTKAGAQYLVSLSSLFSLYPNAQRDWMVASQMDSPKLTVTEDKTGKDLASKWANTGAIDFKVDDPSSGPGFLSVHAAATGLVQGVVDIPTPISLFKDGKIETQNILPSTTVVLSPAKGLVAGHYSAVAYDHAGNSSNLVNFTVPWYALNRVDSASPLYAGFGGVSLAMPSTLERAHTFTFTEPTAGVSSVSVSGPQGELIFWSFSPPVLSTAASLENLPVGEYQVKSWNAVGAMTSTPFKIGKLAVSISSEASTQTYVYPSLASDGTFYFTAHVKAEAPAGVKAVELISPSFGLVSRQESSGTIVSVDFAIPDTGSGYSPTSIGAYTARVTDKEGNIKDTAFQLDQRHADPGLYSEEAANWPAASWTNSYGYKTKVLDLTTGYLSVFSGAILSNYILFAGTAIQVNTGFTGAAVQISGPSRQPGAVSDEVPEHVFGSAKIFINTWGKEDRSDVVQTLLESDSVSVSGPGKIPGAYEKCGFNGSAGVFLCVIAGVHTPRVLPLKRYSEVEVVFDVTAANTYKTCSGSGSETYCSNFAMGASPAGALDVKGYGLSAQWPRATQEIASGANIKVPLNAYGEVEFKNVISKGLLTSSMETSRPPNGFVESPANTAYEILKSSGLVFSGLAKLTLKYNPAGLSAAQEQGLRLAKGNNIDRG